MSSTTNARRLVLTVALLSAVAGIAAIVILGQQAKSPVPAAGTLVPDVAPAPTNANAPAAAAGPAPAGTPSATVAPAVAAPASGWTAAAPGSPSVSAAPIGSLDPAVARFAVELTPQGAGISRIVLSDEWQTAEAAAAARAGKPDDAMRYRLAPPGKLQGFEVPLLGVYAVEVDGLVVRVDGNVWKETAPGAFVTELADPTGALQMRVTRRWSLAGASNEIRCEQRVENLSASAHKVRWRQYGPAELPREPNDSIDSRRFMSGYLMSPARDPGQSTVIVHGATLDQATMAGELAKIAQAAAERMAEAEKKPLEARHLAAGYAEAWIPVWPNERQAAEGYGLSWFGATNRYFALAVHAPYAPPGSGSKAIAPAVASIQAVAGDGVTLGTPSIAVFTTTASDEVTVAAGASAAFDVGVFAGPLERSVLGGTEPFSALNMQGLILYLISGCCSWCTFSWLADAMVWFLTFLHDKVVFDWALAIIMLVVVVRGLLHPLTKRAQVSMMRVSKQMASVAPEMEALKKRYKDDPKRMQEETMRLYRERGINPFGMLGGIVPTFLQMPIWIALYAVLYFAVELRQQPAFFGVFQNFGGWGFLGDLSAQDCFIPLPFSVNLWFFTLSSVNLVPILMGFVFWLQQKYMPQPQMANMTPEQELNQKIMKWMMVFMFPLMLYTSPSGLTLYIATSTLVGIWESKRIRRQMEGMDFTAKPSRKGWFAAAMERAQEAQRQAQARSQARGQAPARKFRDR
jgi:YidC/Oxa1 family membrane protein insertase